MQQVLDSVWVLVCAFLVFFMHAGFALVESGFVRRKNVVMVLLKNVSVVAIGSIGFYLAGYGFMFGEGNAFIGLSMFAPASGEDVGTLPLFVFLFFQLMFAATSCTIVSGAIAERSRLTTFFIFCALALTFIYPVVGHWVWGGGWLASWGFYDFAGSTVVHAVGGGMALAGVLVIGPRLDRYTESGKPRLMPAHSFPFAALGVLILWLGWFGFNGGSTLTASPVDIGLVILSTNLAASAGFLTALIHAKLRVGTLDLSMALNGALAGLVSITAGANAITPVESLVVGSIGGLLVVEGVILLDRFQIDDPVGAIPVHGVCGLFGTIVVGLLGQAEGARGVLHGGELSFLVVQILGSVIATGFAFVAASALWLALRNVPGGVRVSEDHEREGLDLAECGVMAYGEDRSGLRSSAMREAFTSPKLEVAEAIERIGA
ncbi:MAG: ammonium transporter [Myxococcota bacterium]